METDDGDLEWNWNCASTVAVLLLWVSGVVWGALKSAATVTSFVFLFTVLCFLYFVTVNQFCMSDFFTRLRQLYNLLTPSWANEEGAGRMQGAWQELLSSCGSLGLVAAVAVQKRS